MHLIEYDKYTINLNISVLEEILNRDALYRGAIEEGEYMKISETFFDDESQELQVVFDLYQQEYH